MAAHELPPDGGWDDTDDDDAWFDLLAGRASPGASPETRIEAALMREGALADAAAQPALSTIGTIDVEQLVQRAHAAGILAPRGRPAGLRWPDLLGKAAPVRRRFAIAAICSVMGAGLVGVRLLLAPATVDPDLVRDGGDRPVILRSDNPAALSARLVDELARVGITTHRYSRFGRLGIDADLGTPPASGVAEVLASHGILSPPDGVLRIEIESAP